MTFRDILITSGLYSFATTVLLGLFVFLYNRKNPLNIFYGIFAVTVGCWSLGSTLENLIEDEHLALWALRGCYTFAVILPSVFIQFTHIVTDAGAAGRRYLFGSFAVSVFLLPFVFTDFFIEGFSIIEPYHFRITKPGPVYYLFLVFFGLVCTRILLLMHRAASNARGLRRKQLQYIFVAHAIAITAGLDYFSRVIGLISFPPIDDYLLVMYFLVFGYAIVKYRLMDIAVVVRKGVAYAVIVTLLFSLASLFGVLSQRATFHTIPSLVAATLVLALALGVLFEDHRSAKNRAAALISFSLSAWLFSTSMTFSAPGPVEARYWSNLSHVPLVFLPGLFYHFVSAILERKARGGIVGQYAVALAFVALIPTPHLLADPQRFYWGFHSSAGPLYPALLLYIGLSLAASLSRLVAAYWRSALAGSAEAGKLKMLGISALTGSVAVVDLAHLYGREFYPVGPFFILAALVIFVHAASRHPILDLPSTTSFRFLDYARSLGFLLGAYLIIFLLIRLFTGTPQFLLSAIIVATFSLLAGVLSDLQQGVEKAVQRALFRERHDSYETLSEFSRSLVTILDIRSLSDEIIRTLVHVIGVRTASLYLYDQEKQGYFLSSAHGIDQERVQTAAVPAHHPLVQYLLHNQSILLPEEFDSDRQRNLQHTLETLQPEPSQACLPFVNKDRLIGFCCLGARPRHRSYTVEEMNLLTTLAQHAAIALDNAILYEDLKRSQILMRRTDRLRSLETIAGGFAHEIRNPLTSIKTFVQLAPDRKDDVEFIGHFSKVVSEDVDRIERLIEEILDYARYMEPKFTEEDLNDVVASCLYFIEVKAESKSIRIEKDLADDLPPVMLDRQQIKQVLLNLFLNAMDAMSEHGGRLIVRTHRLLKPGGQSWVQIEVGDTGGGISPGDLDHIFDPFYTTKHESGEREGTGLGLTIVHQIVQEHAGYIEVVSQVGAGTTFYVNLPANPSPQTQRREHHEHLKTIPSNR